MNDKRPLKVRLVLYEPRFGAFIWTMGENCLRTDALRRGMDWATLPVHNVDEQAACLLQLVQQGVDAIIMKPMALQHTGISRFIEEAAAAGIPVITLDSPLSEYGIASTVGSDNAEGQRLVTEYVFERLPSGAHVAYFGGDPRVPSGAMRAKSFHNVLDRYPHIHLASEHTLDWLSSIERRKQGAQFMRETLARHQRIDAVICASDESALGTMDAVREAGLSEQILVAGFDGIPEALMALKSGGMSVTVRQLPRSIAKRTLDTVEALCRQDTVPRLQYVETSLITATEVGEAALDSLQMIPGLLQHLASNQEEQRRLQESIIETQQNALNAVSSVSSLLSQLRDPEAMMSGVLQAMADRFGLCGGQVYTRDDAGIHVHASLATPADCAKSIAQRCIDVGGEIQTQDNGVFRLALPLLQGEAATGVLLLESRVSAAFDSNRMPVLKTIARQVAIAMENAKLYRETLLQSQRQQESQDKLLIAEKMASLGRLTAGIAHEMNSPLAAVRASVRELGELVAEYRISIGDASVNETDHREIADEMERAVRLATSASERAASFVRGIKSQTRDLSAQQRIRFNAVEVVREALLLLGHALRQGRCELRFSPDEEVLELEGSPGRLAQVVTNLVTNSIDASLERGGGLIEVGLALHGPELWLTVRDHGSGIPPEVLPKVFDPMFTTKPFGVGTGLGLTIVHDIVVGEFGGSIDIDSVVDEHTSFIVRLKRHPISRNDA